MNWSAIAAGEAPDLPAFEAITDEERLAELKHAWRTVDSSDLRALSNVASTVLQLMDAYHLDDALLRASTSLGLGAAAAELGREEEAVRSFRQLLSQPPLPQTRPIHAIARANLGAILVRTDPQEALRLLRRALADARRERHGTAIVAASLNLAVAQRRVGDHDGAARTIEQAIPIARAEGLRRDLGKLHGNLGNILTDDLRRHDEAIAHYTEAIAVFDEVGEAELAAQRRINLLAAAIATHRDEQVAEALKHLSGAAVASPRSLEHFLTGYEWSDTTPAALSTLEQALCVLEESAPRLNEASRASILAARLVIAGRAGAHARVAEIAHNTLLRDLPSSPLSAVAAEAILQAANETDRQGLYWVAASLVKPPGDLSELKTLYIADEAARRLAGVVDLVTAGAVTEEEALRTMQGAPPVHGLATLPNAASAWLALTAEAAAVFERLRGSLAPSHDAAREKFAAASERVSTSPAGDDRVAAAEQCIRLADLLGVPALQVNARVTLASALGEYPGAPTRERFDAAANRLREAARLAAGVPREEIRALNTLSQVLKSAAFGDQRERLAEAIVGLRRALALADADGATSAAARPIILLNLANALTDYPLRTLGMLREAEAHLCDALARVDAHFGKEGDGDEYDTGGMELVATLHNSLGVVLHALARDHRQPDALAAASERFARALTLRERAGDRARTLVSLSNLVGVRREMFRADGSGGEELGRLAQRARAFAAQCPDLATATGALHNAAQALYALDEPEAMAVARETLERARAFGPSKVFLDACAAAATIHLHFGDRERARELCEEGLAAVERYREEGRSLRYRAQLEWEYGELRRILEVALEMSGAAPEERWWAVERGAARVALDGMRRRGLVADTARDDVVRALAERLPADVAVVYVERALKRTLRGLLVRRHGRSLRYRYSDGKASLDELVRLGGGSIDGNIARLPSVGLRSGEALRTQLAWLAEKIVTPLLGELDPGTTTRVAFVTQGELSNLPWHALPLTDRGATLGDVVDVVEVPSGTILTHLMRQPPRAVRKAVLVACDPFRQLSDHFREVREAFASLEVEERVILTDRSRPVTVSAVLSELRDADVFHFAGHGVGSAGDPEQSGLALSDGLLSVGIIERALAGRAPRIVMLSACRTAEGGAGAAGQVPNLLTAMIGAGATAGIGSLWDVPDHVASRTTDELYQRLTRDGAVRALCEARRVLARASHAARLADPERNAAAEYAWAAFKLVGWD